MSWNARAADRDCTHTRSVACSDAVDHALLKSKRLQMVYHSPTRLAHGCDAHRTMSVCLPTETDASGLCTSTSPGTELQPWLPKDAALPAVMSHDPRHLGHVHCCPLPSRGTYDEYSMSDKHQDEAARDSAGSDAMTTLSQRLMAPEDLTFRETGRPR